MDRGGVVKSARVLVVDDDPLLLAELGEGLEALGLPALAAETAVEALDLVQRNPDLRIIVTDLQMPQIDGIELLQKLAMRRRTPPLLAIVITGDASLDRAVAALRLHAVDFLRKPVSPEEVAASVNRALALVQDNDAREAPAPSTSRPNYLRALLAARADRAAIFKLDLFSDPAWDMLLDLAVAEATQQLISVTSLCLASGVPTTTALRRIDDLQAAGLIERCADTVDRRRFLVTLSSAGRERMEAFVERQASRFGIHLD